MQKNFDISFSQPNCNHHELCSCVITIQGKSQATAHISFTSSPGPLTDQYQELMGKLHSFTDIPDAREELLKEENYIKLGIPKDSVMKLIPPPFQSQPHWPESAVMSRPAPSVSLMMKLADDAYFRVHMRIHASWGDLEKYVWSEYSGVAPLQFLVMRSLSSYHWALGTTKGHPHWIPAMADLYPFKLGKAVLQMARPSLGDRPQPALKYLQEGIRHLYRMMGLDLRQKFTQPFTLAGIAKAYLGSSNGIQQGQYSTLRHADVEIKISPTGKKIDTIEQDLDAILNFLRTGKEPPIYWTVSPKSENAFEWVKQLSDEQWEAARQKLRLFIIPSGVFVLLERLVSEFRHLRERGRVIRIGHRWPHGGADTLAQCLGITELNEMLKCIVEGDATKFDQSVIEPFIEAYFSTMLIHMDKNSPDYNLFEVVVKFLLKNILVRITRLFGNLWATVRGQVPSGCFNTSHMDSWIMGLYIILFCLHQIAVAPDAEKEALEAHFLDIIRMIIYGDDFLYNKGFTHLSRHFSGAAFKSFMATFFNVDIRDLKDGIPFLTTEKNGVILERGATFLRHQIILNPHRDDIRFGPQPRYLPYRESKEFVIRAVHSRESKTRDVVDVLLSIKGLAYATYASNHDAYQRLRCMYDQAVLMCGTTLDITKIINSRLTDDFLKKQRISGVTPEELCGGFPTWDTLIAKNVLNPEYQDISLPGRNYSPDSLDSDDLFCEYDGC